MGGLVFGVLVVSACLLGSSVEWVRWWLWSPRRSFVPARELRREAVARHPAGKARDAA